MLKFIICHPNVWQNRASKELGCYKNSKVLIFLDLASQTAEEQSCSWSLGTQLKWGLFRPKKGTPKCSQIGIFSKLDSIAGIIQVYILMLQPYKHSKYKNSIFYQRVIKYFGIPAFVSTMKTRGKRYNASLISLISSSFPMQLMQKPNLRVLLVCASAAINKYLV